MRHTTPLGLVLCPAQQLLSLSLSLSLTKQLSGVCLCACDVLDFCILSLPRSLSYQYELLIIASRHRQTPLGMCSLIIVFHRFSEVPSRSPILDPFQWKPFLERFLEHTHRHRDIHHCCCVCVCSKRCFSSLCLFSWFRSIISLSLSLPCCSLFFQA